MCLMFIELMNMLSFGDDMMIWMFMVCPVCII